MNEPVPTQSKSAAGRLAMMVGIYGFAFFLAAWWGILRLLPFFVSSEKVGSVSDTIDIIGAICAAVVLGLGFNYVVWKYVEDRWLRWVIFGIEGIVGAFLIYVLLIDLQPTPP